MLEFCPLCYKNGCKRKIILRQINLEEAVWLCEYSECPWPFGCEDFTFVPRKIGETWSKEWDLRKPTPSPKSSESVQISLSELGLDTPPVTPGSGHEVAHKDSLFGESTCSGTSPNLNTNSIIQPKANSGSDRSSSNKLRRSQASECGSIDNDSTGTRLSCDNYASTASLRSNDHDFKSQESLNGVNHGLRNSETASECKGSFTLSDDANSDGLDKCLSASRVFIDACNDAEALTESVFNVCKPSEDNLSIHDSTVKCKKWLSDNTKGTVLGDHCYLSKTSRVSVGSSQVLSKALDDRPRSISTNNSNSTKKLPHIKSIKRTNVKLVPAPNRKILRIENNSASISLEKITSPVVVRDSIETVQGNVEQEITTGNSNHSTIVNDNSAQQINAACRISSETCRVENTTLAIDGLLPIHVSYEIPSFVEECVTIPFSTDCSGDATEKNAEVHEEQERVVDNSVVRDSIETLQGNVEQEITTGNSNHSTIVNDNSAQQIDAACRISSETCRVENRTLAIDGLLPIHVSYEIPSFVEECVTIPFSTDCSGEVKEKNVEVNPEQERVVDNSVVLIDVKVEDCLESKSSRLAINGKTETRKHSMKKPLKRTIPKLAKYQGFNFGALKKSKTSFNSSEENMKSSFSNIPSPDDISNCSDLTWTSETSCATTNTVDSKSESVGSSIYNNLKPTSSVENYSPSTLGSDIKSSSTFSPQNDGVLDSSFNLDQVLDDLLLGESEDLMQGFENNWLESLLH